MTEISIETVAGKLNRIGYEAFMKAHRHAKSLGNRNVELSHLLLHLIQNERSDLVLVLDAAKIDRARLSSDIAGAVSGLKPKVTEMPGISEQIIELLDRGWHYATLMFGETQIRSGHLLVGALKSNDLRRALQAISPEFKALDPEAIARDAPVRWRESDEETLRPMD